MTEPDRRRLISGSQELGEGSYPDLTEKGIPKASMAWGKEDPQHLNRAKL